MPLANVSPGQTAVSASTCRNIGVMAILILMLQVVNLAAKNDEKNLKMIENLAYVYLSESIH